MVAAKQQQGDSGVYHVAGVLRALSGFWLQFTVGGLPSVQKKAAGAVIFQIRDVVMGEWVPTSPRLGSFYGVKNSQLFGLSGNLRSSEVTLRQVCLRSMVGSIASKLGI